MYLNQSRCTTLGSSVRCADQIVLECHPTRVDGKARHPDCARCVGNDRGSRYDASADLKHVGLLEGMVWPVWYAPPKHWWALAGERPVPASSRRRWGDLVEAIGRCRRTPTHYLPPHLLHMRADVRKEFVIVQTFKTLMTKQYASHKKQSPAPGRIQPLTTHPPIYLGPSHAYELYETMLWSQFRFKQSDAQDKTDGKFRRARVSGHKLPTSTRAVDQRDNPRRRAKPCRPGLSVAAALLCSFDGDAGAGARSLRARSTCRAPASWGQTRARARGTFRRCGGCCAAQRGES